MSIGQDHPTFPEMLFGTTRWRILYLSRYTHYLETRCTLDPGLFRSGQASEIAIYYSKYLAGKGSKIDLIAARLSE